MSGPSKIEAGFPVDKQLTIGAKRSMRRILHRSRKMRTIYISICRMSHCGLSLLRRSHSQKPTRVTRSYCGYSRLVRVPETGKFLSLLLAMWPVRIHAWRYDWERIGQAMPKRSHNMFTSLWWLAMIVFGSIIPCTLKYWLANSGRSLPTKMVNKH